MLENLHKNERWSVNKVMCESTQEIAAIKQIEIKEREDGKNYLKEAKILQFLSHPNIIQFREVYKTKKGWLNIVMEYAEKGDMMKMIIDKLKNKEKESKYFTEEKILSYFTQICLALKACHDNMIVHRNLRPQSILITTND